MSMEGSIQGTSEKEKKIIAYTTYKTTLNSNIRNARKSQKKIKNILFETLNYLAIHPDYIDDEIEDTVNTLTEKIQDKTIQKNIADFKEKVFLARRLNYIELDKNYKKIEEDLTQSNELTGDINLEIAKILSPKTYLPVDEASLTRDFRVSILGRAPIKIVDNTKSEEEIKNMSFKQGWDPHEFKSNLGLSEPFFQWIQHNLNQNIYMIIPQAAITSEGLAFVCKNFGLKNKLIIVTKDSNAVQLKINFKRGFVNKEGEITKEDTVLTGEVIVNITYPVKSDEKNISPKIDLVSYTTSSLNAAVLLKALRKIEIEEPEDDVFATHQKAVNSILTPLYKIDDTGIRLNKKINGLDQATIYLLSRFGATEFIKAQAVCHYEDATPSEKFYSHAYMAHHKDATPSEKFYSYAYMARHEDATPSEKFSSYAYMAHLASRGNKQAKEELKLLLPHSTGKLNNPKNLAFAMLMQDAISLEECFNLKPFASEDKYWRNEVLNVALNYPTKFKEGLINSALKDEIISNEIDKTSRQKRSLPTKVFNPRKMQKIETAEDVTTVITLRKLQQQRQKQTLTEEKIKEIIDKLEINLTDYDDACEKIKKLSFQEKLILVKNERFVSVTNEISQADFFGHGNAQQLEDALTDGLKPEELAKLERVYFSEEDSTPPANGSLNKLGQLSMHNNNETSPSLDLTHVNTGISKLDETEKTLDKTNQQSHWLLQKIGQWFARFLSLFNATTEEIKDKSISQINKGYFHK